MSTRCAFVGSLLLTSADELCLWEESGNASDREVECVDQLRGWQKVWSRDVPVPPTIIKFTMDSTMFATCGEVRFVFCTVMWQCECSVRLNI